MDWDNQRAFLAVLETGSLSGAARELGLSQPTVRHRIEALQRALGLPLFVRAPQGLIPTAQAQELHRHALAMSYASDAFVRAASAAPDDDAGRVRLSVSEFVGVHILPLMLARLRLAHPALGIELSLSNEPADVLGQEVDIAIRMMQPQQQALITKKAGTCALRFYASRDYVARNGLPDLGEGLAAHHLIAPDRARGDLAVMAGLDARIEGAAIALRTDSHPAQFAAIRAGLGIGVVQESVGDGDDRLVRVLDDLQLPVLHYWVVMHEDLRATRRIRVVFDHLVRELASYLR